MIAIAKRYQSTVKTRPSVPCTGLEACKIPLAPARNCAKPSQAGEVKGGLLQRSEHLPYLLRVPNDLAG